MTQEEQRAYRKAFEQALKETREAFPTLSPENLDEATAFRDRRTCEIILASPGRLQRILREVLLPPTPAAVPTAIPSPPPAPPPLPKPSAKILPLKPLPTPQSSLQPSEQVANDALYGAEQIAEFLGVTEQAVYYLAHKKRIPVGKLGRTLIASRRTLKQALAQITS